MSGGDRASILSGIDRLKVNGVDQPFGAELEMPLLW
jgi:hypothetical protein